ncbi:MAG: S-layer homology domain-containing protein [Chloroflexi bacterium]|nr:S-layer homology domain-containing protein [Chloroflexota bacterium]
MVALVILGALLIIGIPTAVLAAQVFNDVPPGAQFYDEINAIAGAGITTGCGSGNYCPDDTVTRKAMAAFMDRGFGRVTRTDFLSVSIPTVSGTPAITTTITPGLPAIALPGATGFVKADVSIGFNNITGGGAVTETCIIRGNLRLNNVPGTMAPDYIFVSIDSGASGTRSAAMTLTGAQAVNSSTPQNVSVVLYDYNSRCSGLIASGTVTASYFPFGGTGGSTLAPPSAPQRGSSATRDQ